MSPRCKYHTLTNGILSPDRATALQEIARALDTGGNTQTLLDEVLTRR